ncbi:hypothetical protein QBC37DRAFT_481818 [Rhypophila decipiens]|uniref:Uncharacterized protein n=1 Tax=Rhypophila decipiens TaxID=261697 RepID=A0AAN6YBU2_9PEZI|nr:hypothetical protein QBC37DRAFT_481818 [Rhypophila decipiens]
MPRGRPKKNPVQVSADEGGTSDTITGVPSPAPKRRGRTRKNPVVQPQQENTDKDDVQDAPADEIDNENVQDAPADDIDVENVQDAPADVYEPEPPTPVRRGRGRPKKVDTPGSASSTTKSSAQGYVKTGRPRGRPPKASKTKTVSFSTTPAAQASATPTGRGRGRPPTNAGTSSAAQPSVVQEPVTPFALESLVGSYTVRSPAIEAAFLPELANNEDESEDEMLHGTLEIERDDTVDDDMLSGTFEFGAIRGTMALALSLDRLNVWAADDDDEDSGGDNDFTMALAEADRKRKEAPVPVTRGRGRPRKRQNVLPTVEQQNITIYFVYFHEISNDRGKTVQKRRYGTLEPDDAECTSVHEGFDNFPVIDKVAVFQAKKKVEEAAESSEASVEG